MTAARLTTQAIFCSLISIGGGGFIGSVSGLMGMTDPIGAFVGLTVGAIIGVFVTPFIIGALHKKPLEIAWPIVILPPIVPAMFAGASGSLAAVIATVVVFCAMAAIASLVLADIPERVLPGICKKCGYDAKELATCPECGVPTEAEPQAGANRPTDAKAPGPVLTVALICILGVILPTGFTIHAHHERHRARTPAEWVERLGEHDMQIQWEARRAVSRAGLATTLSAATHPDRNVRTNAMWVLEDFRGPEVRAALEAALSDPDRYVRDRAAETLRKMTTP